MSNILIIYYFRYQFPMRKAIEEHLYSFKKYGQEKIHYLNAAFDFPSYLKKMHWDVIIYHTTYLSVYRWGGQQNPRFHYEKCLEENKVFERSSACRAILPQDEFYNSVFACRFINDMKITDVFSVSPMSEWPKIYKEVNFEHVRFHKVLTGYLADDVLKDIDQLRVKNQNRTIDIGYRAWKAEFWLGRHGLLKNLVGEIVNKAAKKVPVKTDISNEQKDVLLGLDWYRFLLRCKFVLGVEGGSSILDYKGDICCKVNEYLKNNPTASFEEVERCCFPEEDGKLSLFAISPRHFEACATLTCQILVEGEYDGVLKPYVHYIPLKKDFSNIQEVLEILADNKTRETIVENAYRDIVASKKFHYSHFVSFVLTECMKKTGSFPVKNSFLFSYVRVRENAIRSFIPIEFYLRSCLKKILPNKANKYLRKILGKALMRKAHV